MNCWVLFTLTDAEVGETETDVTVAVAVTVKLADPLNPFEDALIFALPAATPVASPGVDCPVVRTVAFDVLEDDQLADVVTSCVVPSL